MSVIRFVPTAPTPLRNALEEAFGLYIRELQNSVGSLGTLHLVCAIPDVCAALESANGTTSGKVGKLYQAWAARNVVKGDPVMTEVDWWKLRCSVLHQGSSLPIHPGGDVSQYASVSFVVADADKPMHRVALDTPEGKNLTLHVPMMAAEMVGVLDGWFTWLDSSDADSVRGNVQQHLRTVISPRPKTWPGHETTTVTWSSTGALSLNWQA